MKNLNRITKCVTRGVMDPKLQSAEKKNHIKLAFQTLPFIVVRMKRAMTALFRPQVDLATQDRMVNGFNR